MGEVKRVLLTGVSGFMGAHTLEEILSTTDWHVVGVASWRHKGTPERIQEVLKGHPEWAERLDIITHDLTAPFTPHTIARMGYCDYIINIASESHVERSIEDPVPFVMNNIQLMLNLLEYARQMKPEKFLQISTDEVYGPAPDGVNFEEWSTLLPSNPYSASKACQESLAVSYWRTYGVPIIITNTMNLFGEMQDNEKYIAQLIRKIHEGDLVTVHGKDDDIGSRYYLHARNQANALVYILNEVPVAKYPRYDRPTKYNIVGDIEMDNLSLAQLVAKMMNKDMRYVLVDHHTTRPGHDKRYALDGTALKERGWRAPKTFHASLQKYIDWTLANPEWL